MTFQIIRKDGKVKGIALIFGDGYILAAPDPPNSELWRVCDHCHQHKAIVFCRWHTKYVCSACLRLRLHPGCEFLSVSAVKQKWSEVTTLP